MSISSDFLLFVEISFFAIAAHCKNQYMMTLISWPVSVHANGSMESVVSSCWRCY